MRPFIKSVLLGALAGAAPYLLLSALFTLIAIPRAFSSWREFGAMVTLAISPLIVAVPIVAAGALLIGLPTGHALQRWNRESALAYTGSGCAAGALMAAAPAWLLDVPDPPWAVALGAIGGAVTGLSWWRLARSPRAREADAD